MNKSINLCSGTLPAKMFQKTQKYKAERCPFFWNLVIRAGMSTLPKFRPNTGRFWVILEVILVIWADRAPQRSPVDTQGGSETTFSWFLMDLGLLFGSPGVHFGGHFGACFVKWTFFKLFLEVFFGLWKRSENGAPQGGVDMQSAHAGACFVRVGTCRPGTVLGSILGAFWEPKSALYSVLVDLGCKLGAQKQCGGRGCVLWCPGCQNGPFRVVPAKGGKPTIDPGRPRARRKSLSCLAA